ncbi:hypothetical protein NPIL_505321 [Nephila pilipes]|uniref:Uncharacterized protein n=1 Tax=Nephila pilipes TaxID=299642 RepID=A0A8X6TL03_NEPPI|nr:hypothetical protein NPIL_505321 [Nephila pilipes]
MERISSWISIYYQSDHIGIFSIHLGYFIPWSRFPQVLLQIVLIQSKSRSMIFSVLIGYLNDRIIAVDQFNYLDSLFRFRRIPDFSDQNLSINQISASGQVPHRSPPHSGYIHLLIVNYRDVFCQKLIFDLN